MAVFRMSPYVSTYISKIVTHESKLPTCRMAGVSPLLTRYLGLFQTVSVKVSISPHSITFLSRTKSCALGPLKGLGFSPTKPLADSKFSSNPEEEVTTVSGPWTANFTASSLNLNDLNLAFLCFFIIFIASDLSVYTCKVSETPSTWDFDVNTHAA